MALAHDLVSRLEGVSEVARDETTMMLDSLFNRPVIEIIRQRYSCRAYDKTPIAAEQARQLAAFAEAIVSGPLGAPLRFRLAVAQEQDPKALRGLGTYGLIRNPAGFIIGAADQGEKRLEDFGYGMEAVVLYATSLGLGTCWLGGNFTKSSFAAKIGAARHEIVPAVASIGYPADGIRDRDPLRWAAKSDKRLPWEALFFCSTDGQAAHREAQAPIPNDARSFWAPLAEASAGAYAVPLAMLRLAPSASNRQPWRVVQDSTVSDEACYYFYLQRTSGYGRGTLPFTLLGLADLQRVDMGIAMCHFELAARELGLEGQWVVDEPDLPKPGETTEYIVTWKSKGGSYVRTSRAAVADSASLPAPDAGA